MLCLIQQIDNIEHGFTNFILCFDFAVILQKYVTKLHSMTQSL